MLAADVDYVRDVKPLLKEKCSACHGPLAQKGGLRLDAGALIRQGGDGGVIVDLESPDQSELLNRITAEDDAERMPPASEGERLTPSEIAILSAWIRGGAKSPADEEVLADPRAHWAYQVPRPPEVPAATSAEWSINPIDAFIAQKQAEKGMMPVGLADRSTLLRRVYLDLIGVPPARDELHAFLADESPDAYEKVVSRLLDSPHYGERWGRHWMDVWRYSDWNGFKQELRGSQRHIWRWRDWIIESLNADKGYDRMIVEMLAADEIAPSDADSLRATGFLARNFHWTNRNIWLDSVVEHTAKGFLGITMNCVKCHDHKYDPIPQEDYYRFRAIFEPQRVRTDRLPGQPDVMLDGLPRVYDDGLETPTYLYVRGNEKHPDKEHPLPPAIPRFFEFDLAIKPISLPVESWYPALRDDIEREDVAQMKGRVAKLEVELLDAVESDSPTMRLTELQMEVARRELAALEARWAADKSAFLANGDASQARELAAQAVRLERETEQAQAELAAYERERFPEQAEKNEKAKADAAKTKKNNAAPKRTRGADKGGEPVYTPVGTIYPRESSGRRTALARWIASPDNPLTARVAINHIWLRHFGAPLVDKVFDFGLNSPRPLHHELLDWLACELVSPTFSRDLQKSADSEGNSTIGGAPPAHPLLKAGEDGAWSMKRLHRLIVTSRTYRLSSSSHQAAPVNREIDPDNLYYWRFNVRRLEAEAIRDSVLAAAGALDTTLGGPDIDYSAGETKPRRSIYFRTAYEKQMQFLQIFDAASPIECYRRSESVVPQQALALANSSFTLAQSRKLARELWRQVECGPAAQEAFVRAVYEQILSREPALDELQACLTFLSQQRQRNFGVAAVTLIEREPDAQVELADPPSMRAREDLVHVLFNHNDFVTVR